MKNRRTTGGSIAEMAAAMTVFLPVVIALTFLILEVSQAYLLKTCLAQGARQAARDLAIAYGKDPMVASNRSMQELMALDHVRIKNIINDSEQFEAVEFNTAAIPHTVYVRVRYTSGQHGLPLFPHPDPLNMGDKLQIASESTFRLE